jgi:hypothetical protein
MSDEGGEQISWLTEANLIVEWDSQASIDCSSQQDDVKEKTWWILNEIRASLYDGWYWD